MNMADLSDGELVDPPYTPSSEFDRVPLQTALATQLRTDPTLVADGAEASSRRDAT